MRRNQPTCGLAPPHPPPTRRSLQHAPLACLPPCGGPDCAPERRGLLMAAHKRCQAPLDGPPSSGSL